MSTITLKAKPGAGIEALTLSEEALHLAIDLDLEGRELVRMPDGRLRVVAKVGMNPAPLSDNQRAKIAACKHHLLALVGYCAETQSEG